MFKLLTNPLITSWANSILGLLGFLLVVPIASNHLSDPQFTLWLFANSIIAVGILFESAVSVVFTRTLTAYIERRSISRNDCFQAANDKVAVFISTSLILYLVVGLIGGLTAYLAGVYSIDGLISIGLDPAEAHQTLLALGAIACSSILLSFGRSVLIANQQMRVQRSSMLITTIGKLLVSVTIFSVIPRVDYAMAAITLVNVLEILFLTVLSWKVQRLALRSRPNLRVMDEFAVPFVKTFLIRIGGYLAMYSSSVIIVRYAPTNADAYLLSFRLVQAAASVSMIPVSISLPALTRLRVRIEADQQPVSAFVDAALRIIAFGLSCMLFMLLGLLLLGPWMLEIATSDKTLLEPAALAYLCLIFFLESHHVAHSMVYETQNRVPFLAISIVSGVVILGLSMLLVPHFGIWGGLVTLNLVQISGNNWFPVWLNLRQWGMSWTVYLRFVVRMLLHPSPSKIINSDA